MAAKKSNKTKSSVSGKGLGARASVPVWMVLVMVGLVVVLGVFIVYKSLAAPSQRYVCYDHGSEVGSYYQNSYAGQVTINGMTCNKAGGVNDYLRSVAGGNGWALPSI